MLDTLSDSLLKWSHWRSVLFFAIVLVVYLLITIPPLLSSPGGEIESLDRKFNYNSEDAFETIKRYAYHQNHGDIRGFWMYAQLTWDSAFPLLYFLFLSSLISRLLRSAVEPGSSCLRLNLAPLSIVLFDLCENLSIVFLFWVYPWQPALIANLASFFTTGKFALAILVVLVLIPVLAARAFMNNFRIMPIQR